MVPFLSETVTPKLPLETLRSSSEVQGECTCVFILSSKVYVHKINTRKAELQKTQWPLVYLEGICGYIYDLDVYICLVCLL